MSLFGKNVSVKLASVYKAGTNAGATATLLAVSGKTIYLESISGFNDAAAIIEVRNSLTGTIAITNTDATITGTGTAFTTELIVGDTIRHTDSAEVFIVDSITNDTSLEATVAASSTDASSAAVRLVAEFKPAAAGNINIVVGGSLFGSRGTTLDVALLSSTADCSITATGYTL
jgi:hypothetical protein|tara:strand:- start:12226 stop:12747 length:522 start_codon:yes stop_codon:yes gene_type:complete